MQMLLYRNICDSVGMVRNLIKGGLILDELQQLSQVTTTAISPYILPRFLPSSPPMSSPSNNNNLSSSASRPDFSNLNRLWLPSQPRTLEADRALERSLVSQIPDNVFTDTDTLVNPTENNTPLPLRLSLPPTPELHEYVDWNSLDFSNPTQLAIRSGSPIIYPDSPIYTPSSPQPDLDTPIYRTAFVPRSPAPGSIVTNMGIATPQPQYDLRHFLDVNWLHNWVQHQNALNEAARREDTPFPPEIVERGVPVQLATGTTDMGTESSDSIPASTPLTTPVSHQTAFDTWNLDDDPNGNHWHVSISEDPTYTSAKMSWDALRGSSGVHGVRRFHIANYQTELRRAEKRFPTDINRFINAAEETENWKLLVRETYLYNPLAAHDIQAYRDMEKMSWN